MSRWAPDDDAGRHAYVVETHRWGRTTTRVEYADNLADAKAKYGWTRELHTSIKVRRAKTEDVQA